MGVDHVADCAIEGEFLNIVILVRFCLHGGPQCRDTK